MAPFASGLTRTKCLAPSRGRPVVHSRERSHDARPTHWTIRESSREGPREVWRDSRELQQAPHSDGGALGRRWYQRIESHVGPLRDDAGGPSVRERTTARPVGE